MMRAVAVLVALFAVTARAQQCGWQAGGKLCPGGLCCSRDGYCGSTDPWCGDGCQSQCDGGGGGGGGDCGGGGGGGGEEEEGGDGVASIISRSLFEEMLKHRNDVNCPARCFYTYDAFIAAAKFFPGFGTTGDLETRKRELAAFLGQTSQETNGGWADAPGGPYAWGYCFKEEVGGPATPDSQYCLPSERWPCVPGKKYYGRGPIQLSWNYNYGQAGEAKEIATDLLHDPDLVAHDPILSFKTAIWFWMTPQSPKPSCHDVMTGQWVPSPNDIAAGRLPGYGVTTNIINGGLECGFPGPDSRVENRIGFYKRYCDLLGVTYGDNLDCYNQRSFAATSSASTTSSSYHADA